MEDATPAFLIVKLLSNGDGRLCLVRWSQNSLVGVNASLTQSWDGL